MAGQDQSQRDVLREVDERRYRPEPSDRRSDAFEAGSSACVGSASDCSTGAGEKEPVGDQEGSVQRQLPPHGRLPRPPPLGDDLLAARDTARRLEGEQGGAMITHRAHRGQHRGATKQRQGAESEERAPCAGDNEEVRKWCLLHS